METITTVTCSIWSEDAFSSACSDVNELQSEEAAKNQALADAIDIFTENGGDFTAFFRIWYTVVSFPNQKRNDPTIIATLPPIPDPEPITATVS